MIELLFIEIGAVLAEIRGEHRCAIEPFCSPALPPTFKPDRRVEVDFARSLDNLSDETPLEQLAQQALYDQLVAPIPGRRVPIGPSWPGGGYEGIVSVREDALKTNDLLATAASSLAGPRCKYQIVATIDPQRTVRRYHGFHAQVLRLEGRAIVLKVGNCPGEIKYDPDAAGAADKYYAGELVDGNILRAGVAPGSTGGLFMTQTAFSSLAGVDEEFPKLPPSAGL
jgi:hypothetical protein